MIKTKTIEEGVAKYMDNLDEQIKVSNLTCCIGCGMTREAMEQILQDHEKQVRDEIIEIISKKADEYNTEQGVDTCATLVALKIKIESPTNKQHHD